MFYRVRRCRDIVILGVASRTVFLIENLPKLQNDGQISIYLVRTRRTMQDGGLEHGVFWIDSRVFCQQLLMPVTSHHHNTDRPHKPQHYR